MKEALLHHQALKNLQNRLKEELSSLRWQYTWYSGDGSIQGEQKAKEIQKRIVELEEEIEKLDNEMLKVAWGNWLP